MFRLLHELATYASSIQELTNAINLRPEKDELLDLLEKSCDTAKEILIEGLSKAFEHDYDSRSVERHVTGPERTVAILACQDTAGEYAMYSAIRTVLVIRSREEPGTLV